MMRFSRWPILPAALLALAGCGGGSDPSGGGGSATSSSSGTASSSGTSSSSSGSSHVFSTSDPNVVAMSVGPGPGTSTAFNIPTASVTICQHGTQTCKTIDKVLVDTGSYGLRLVASALGGFSVTPQQDPANNGRTISECQQFLDGYTWGPVTVVDVKIGSETATSLPINVLDDSASPSPAPPASCVNGGGSGSSSGGGTNLSSVSALGANGVLGVGYLHYDCDLYCAEPVSQQTQGYLYYSCNSTSCAATSEALADQVANPVARFSGDNNGVILQLPSIPPDGQKTASGYLVFGIGTRANNGLQGASVLTISTAGYINTTYNGQTLSKSFIDSGSNGYFFPDSTIQVCSVSKDFFCPTTSPLQITVTNMGLNGTTTSNIPLDIVNVDNRNTAFYAIDVGGPDGTGLSSAFDFGLPFFYGRTVFTAIDGMTAGSITGPYYAY